MKLIIKNLGPIKKSCYVGYNQIDLSKRLLIFTGKNNTGKTLTAELIASICDSYTHDKFLNSLPANLPTEKKFLIDEETINASLDSFTSFVSSLWKENYNLPVDFKLSIDGINEYRDLTVYPDMTPQVIAEIPLSILTKTNIIADDFSRFSHGIFSQAKGKHLLLADLPENGLHPERQIEVAKQIIAFLQNQTNRVILVTHSEIIFSTINIAIYIDILRSYYSESEIQEIIKEKKLPFVSAQHRLSKEVIGAYEFKENEILDYGLSVIPPRPPV